MYFIYAYDTDAPIELRYVTMTIEDGASNTVEFTFDEGDFSWDSSFEWKYRANRGVLGAANGASVTQGDDQPMSLSFDGRYSKFKTSGAITTAKPQEILTNADGAFTTTDVATCATYCCNITLTNLPICGDGEVLLFPDFRIEGESYGIRDGKVSFSGKCNATRPTVVV